MPEMHLSPLDYDPPSRETLARHERRLLRQQMQLFQAHARLALQEIENEPQWVNLSADMQGLATPRRQKPVKTSPDSSPELKARMLMVPCRHCRNNFAVNRIHVHEARCKRLFYKKKTSPRCAAAAFGQREWKKRSPRQPKRKTRSARL